jgi:hypothetical protein
VKKKKEKSRNNFDIKYKEGFNLISRNNQKKISPPFI